jgi:hypothetical protein
MLDDVDAIGIIRFVSGHGFSPSACVSIAMAETMQRSVTQNIGV